MTKPWKQLKDQLPAKVNPEFNIHPETLELVMQVIDLSTEQYAYFIEMMEYAEHVSDEIIENAKSK